MDENVVELSIGIALKIQLRILDNGDDIMCRRRLGHATNAQVYVDRSRIRGCYCPAW